MHEILNLKCSGRHQGAGRDDDREDEHSLVPIVTRLPQVETAALAADCMGIHTCVCVCVFMWLCRRLALTIRTRVFPHPSLACTLRRALGACYHDRRPVSIACAHATHTDSVRHCFMTTQPDEEHTLISLQFRPQQHDAGPPTNVQTKRIS